MEALAIFSGIISLITLIVFFGMAANVSAIRSILENTRQKEVNNPTATSVKTLNNGSSLEVYNFDGWLKNKKVTINGTFPLDGEYTLMTGEVIIIVNGFVTRTTNELEEWTP